MQLHNIKRIKANKKRMTVGRGGKRGKTAGRGTKGQNARAGHKKRPEMRDIIKKIPKLRGYAFQSFQVKHAVVNLSTLEEKFAKGGSVTPAILVDMGIVTLRKGKIPEVKILATGDIKKKFIIEKCAISASAKDKVVKAGGEVK